MSPRSRTADVPALIEAARAGQPRAVGRLISLVENESDQLREVAAALGPATGSARVIGLTGSPGVGKSTTTSALVSAYRERDLRVGVLAVDPSSPFTGGALLGDRVRMQQHATDARVFVRSLATRGHLGGLAAAVPQAVRVLDGAGFDVILIETVGVGQSEIDIVRQADTTVVLMAPGMGDGIQAAKAGIIEIADVFVVNKADRPGAEVVTRDLRHLQSYLAEAGADGAQARWRVPIVKASAETGQGVTDIVEALDSHHAFLKSHGLLQPRRTRRALAEVEALALAGVRRRFDAATGEAGIDDLAGRIAAGELTPHEAAEKLLAAMG